MLVSAVGNPPGAPIRRRRPWLLWVVVAVPCSVLLVTGTRLISREQELEARQRKEARTQQAAGASLAIVEQLRGIVLSEAVALGSADYVESSTVLVARLTARGLILPWRRAHASASGSRITRLRQRDLSPERCRGVLIAAARGQQAAVRDRCSELDQVLLLARDTATLAAVRGTFGEPRLVAWNDGHWLVAMAYADASDPIVVAVRTRDLVRAAGVPLGDSLAVIAAPRAGAVPLSAGLRGLWLAWTNGSAPHPAWDGRQGYMVATLVSVMITAMIAAFVLNRDVRREVRLAQVRQQFVASVSHELRTPLTAIRMYAETLRDRRVSAEAQAEYLDTIVGESDRLSRLVDNVLGFSRIEHGKRVYRLVDGNLEATVRAAIRTLHRSIEQQGFLVQVFAAAGLPAVRFDPDAIGQAVINLLGNAMKYSAGARAIDVTIGCDGREATVGIRDHGIGVPDAERERIFDAFHRAPGTPAEVAGAGLGLTLVRHALTAHGGRVTVDAAPGGGSVFVLHLPRVTAS